MPGPPTDPNIRFFVGTFAHTLDKVNRVVIPAKWRTGKSEELVIISKKEGCLAILPQMEVMKIFQQIQNASDLNPSQKKSKRELIFSDAEQVTCDAHGRITMGGKQLKHAGLKEAVVLVGLGERFDMWEPGAWALRKLKDEPERIATLEEFGI